MRLVFALLAAALVLGAAPAPSAAKSNETIYIAAGVPVAAYSDKLNGPQVRDYIYPASKGQKLDVSLSSKSDKVYFKIQTPGGGARSTTAQERELSHRDQDPRAVATTRSGSISGTSRTAISAIIRW